MTADRNLASSFGLRAFFVIRHSDFVIGQRRVLNAIPQPLLQRFNPSMLSSLDGSIVASKFSASLAHETLPAVCNRRWCRIGHIWKRNDALSRKASAG